MRFDRCYVQPLCTPTRVGLMTGMSNARNYIEFGNMEPKSTTFGNLLKKAGYATAIAGKWQLGHDKDLPQRFGFDESCLWQHTRRPPRYANPGLEYNGVERDFNKGEYGPDLVSDFALKFIDENKSKPFFLYYPMMLTHAPYQPTPDSPDWDPKARGEQVNHDNKHFADMVAYMDKLVGKVVTKLDDLKLRDNTLHPLPRRQRHRQRRPTHNSAASNIRAAKATPTPAACTCRSSPTGRATSAPAA